MAKRLFTTDPEVLTLINRHILGIGGSPAARAARRSLIEIVIGRIGKPLKDVIGDDILIMRDWIHENIKKPNYERRLIYAMRQFFLWYYEQGKQTKEIKNIVAVVKSVKLPAGQWKCKSDKDMLSARDIETAIRAAGNDRDKCFIAMCYDGSNRPIELINLNWGGDNGLRQDEYGYWFETSQKTGIARRIRLTKISIPYLEQLRKSYPLDPNGDAPVFLNLRKIQGKYKRWDPSSMKFMFSVIRNKTGLKNFKPGTIRPSRITADVEAGYELPYVMKKNWGTLKTKMIDKYTNLSDGYMDQTALRHAGMARVEEMKKNEIYNIEPPVCTKCQTLNTIGSLFCSRCLTPLGHIADVKVEASKEMIENDPRFKTAFAAAMAAIKKSQ